MYWNNAIHQHQWPSDQDPIVESMHQGRHCLFYNPQAKFDCIQTNQRLADLCAWAMARMIHGLDKFFEDSRNWYDAANLVKLNMWIADIRHQGIVKPWLIQDQGDGSYIAGTGDSRLRALERIPEIQSVPAFISTSQHRAYLYSSLEPVTNFDQFAHLCSARPKQTFLFKYTDVEAPYGLYWYEYDSDRTRAVTPSETECVAMLRNYLTKNPDAIIEPAWFDDLVPWKDYRSNS